MYKLRRRAGTSKRCRYFTTDMAALSHATDNNAPLDRCEQRDSLRKSIVYSLLECGYGLKFNGDSALCRFDR